MLNGVLSNRIFAAEMYNSIGKRQQGDVNETQRRKTGKHFVSFTRRFTVDCLLFFNIESSSGNNFSSTIDVTQPDEVVKVEATRRTCSPWQTTKVSAQKIEGIREKNDGYINLNASY
jgi:hypothetical protein